jgi:hypothetical protein
MNEIHNRSELGKPTPVDGPIVSPEPSPTNARFCAAKKPRAVGLRRHHRSKLIAASSANSGTCETPSSVATAAIAQAGGGAVAPPAAGKDSVPMSPPEKARFSGISGRSPAFPHTLGCGSSRATRLAGLRRMSGSASDETPRSSSRASAAGERRTPDRARASASARRRQTPPPNPAAFPQPSACRGKGCSTYRRVRASRSAAISAPTSEANLLICRSEIVQSRRPPATPLVPRRRNWSRRPSARCDARWSNCSRGRQSSTPAAAGKKSLRHFRQCPRGSLSVASPPRTTSGRGTVFREHIFPQVGQDASSPNCSP